MMSYLIGFFLPLAGLAISIFLLSLLMQYGIYGNIGKQGGNAEAQDPAADEQEGDINQTRRDPIADAIHAYRRSRRTDEGERAQRERVTAILRGHRLAGLRSARLSGRPARHRESPSPRRHRPPADPAPLRVRDRREPRIGDRVELDEQARRRHRVEGTFDAGLPKHRSARRVDRTGTFRNTGLVTVVERSQYAGEALL